MVGDLEPAYFNIFFNKTSVIEKCVLGLIVFGQLFSSPWMKAYHTSSLTQTHHMHGFLIIKDVISELKAQLNVPSSTPTKNCNFFLKIFPQEDSALITSRRRCNSIINIFINIVHLSL